MKTFILLALICLCILACKKDSPNIPLTTGQNVNYLQGYWLRSSFNDTTFTGTKVDSIHYWNVQLMGQSLDFTTETSGSINNGGNLISFSYSLDKGIIVLPNGTWALTKISDTHIKLSIRISNVGWDDEYIKE